jgi:hypothetical protein
MPQDIALKHELNDPDVVGFLIESLVGTVDPLKLAQDLGYASVAELLTDNNVATLGELLQAPLQPDTVVPTAVLRFKLEKEAVRLGYRNRHAFCDPSWSCRSTSHQ